MPHFSLNDKTVWPVGLVLTACLFMAIMFRMVYLAGHGFEGPDDVRYYQMGLEYNKEVKRQEWQHRRDWDVQTEVNARHVAVTATDEGGRPVTGELRVDFGHPATLKDRDSRACALQNGHANLDWQPGPGVWDVTVHVLSGGREWRHRERLRVP